MPVSFNDIPSSLRLPLFHAEIDPSRAGTFSNYQRALVIGYKTAAGTQVADTRERISSRDVARAKGGAGSQYWAMFDAYFKNRNFDEVWGVVIDEPATGTKASGTITVTGPATSSGTIALLIAGRRVPVGVTVGDSAGTVATAISAAINAAEGLPAVATVASAVVTVTARWKGIDGNGIDIRHSYYGSLGGEQLPSGLSLAIGAMSGGVGVPDLSAALAALGDDEFDTVVIGWTDTGTLNAVDAEWNHVGDTGRWSWQRQIYGNVYTAADGSVGTLQTLGSARNGAHVTCFGYNGSPTPTWERAAMFAAQAHRSLMTDPARPLHTLPLVGMLPAAPGLRFTKAEKNSLAYDGISVAKENDDGTCQIETSFSMYQTNTHGLADNAMLKIQTVATLAYVLRSLRFRIVQKFPRHKLGNDGTRYGPGQAICTPKTARAEIVCHYRELEYIGLVENAAAFKANLIVERNVNNPDRLDVLYPPDLVNQLDVFAVLAQFRLQYPADLPETALAIG